MSNAAQVLDHIAAALANGPYKVSRDVPLPDGTKAALVASRTYFSWKGLVILSQHVVVRHIDSATPADAKALFEAGFRIGKKANWLPLPRGMQFGYMIIPVIVGNTPDPALVEAVTQRPVKHWALFEYPVVVDLTTNQTFSFTRTPLWGAFYFSDSRRVVEKFIAGALSTPPA